MMWLSATPAERRLIPSSGVRGPAPVLIAVMMFVMVTIGAAGLALANAASSLRAGIEHGYTIQIAAGADRAGTVANAVRSVPGVIRAEPVPPEELRRTLERWLGAASQSADLPLPGIIDVDLAPDATADALSQALTKAAPDARLVANRGSLAPLLASLWHLGLVALAMVLLVAFAGGAAVVLATRAALENHRATIRVMHGVGATDDQVARLFQRQIAIDALVGGLAGAGLAALVILSLLGGASIGVGLSGVPPLGWIDAALLATLPLIGAALATIVARIAVLRALRAWL